MHEIQRDQAGQRRAPAAQGGQGIDQPGRQPAGQHRQAGEHRVGAEQVVEHRDAGDLATHRRIAQVVEGAIETVRPAQVQGRQHQRDGLHADQAEQGHRPGHRMALRRDHVQAKARTEKQHQKSADHGLGDQCEDHQRVLARAELLQAPGDRPLVLVHLGHILAALALGIALVAQRHRVGAFHLARQRAHLLETDVRVGDVRGRKTGNAGLQLIAVLRPGLDHAEIQRATETGRRAGRLQADLQAIDAHVAFRHVAGLGIQLRRVVRAHPGAVTAAEADIRVLQHRAIFRELGIGARRAALQAHRIVAMIARHRDVQTLIGGIAAALDIADRTKRQVWRQIVLLGTGRLAGVAGDTGVGGKIKAMLLVAVRVVRDRGVAVDVQALTTPRVAFRHGLDRLAVAIGLRVLGLRHPSVVAFFRSWGKHGFSRVGESSCWFERG